MQNFVNLVLLQKNICKIYSLERSKYFCMPDIESKYLTRLLVFSYKFLVLQIRDLLDRMRTNWPTLACPSGDGSKFWEHEWEKHGTCSESMLDQHSYFATALNLKNQVNILQSLKSAGIEPDGGFYSLTSIKNAIREATGFTPGLECNVDESRNSQLYQVYLCVDASGSQLIECPVYPRGKCSSRVEFPAF